MAAIFLILMMITIYWRMALDKILYHEIDLLIPVHRFKINYSYTREKRMEFVREFLLRLVRISPLKPRQIATYFGFSKIELNEAISNLVNKDELDFSDDGDVVLTSRSKSYFTKSGGTPEVLAFFEDFIFLNYELVGFNPVKSRENEDNRLGLKLQVDNEVIANSAKEIKSVFQKNFLKYFQDKVLLTRNMDREGKTPNLYAMGEAILTGRKTLRLSNEFFIDFDLRPVQRSNFSELIDSSNIHDSITSKLSELQKIDNTEQVFGVMDAETKKFFSEKTFFDMKKLLQTRVELLSEKNKSQPIPFVGSIYLNHNWDLIIDELEKLNKASNVIDDSSDLIWIAPDDPFWGKSHKLISCISDLIQRESTRRKKAHRLFNTRIFLPLPKDEKKNRFINQTEYNFKGFVKNISYIENGFSSGNIEILLLPNCFVAVNYHLSIPNILPVTIPIGFISIDHKTIENVKNQVDDFLSNQSIN